MARCPLLPQHPQIFMLKFFVTRLLCCGGPTHCRSLHLAKSAAQMNMGVWRVTESLCCAL